MTPDVILTRCNYGRNVSGMDAETRSRLAYAWETWNTKRAETAVARETLQREMQAAVDAGVSKAELGRMFGISRQAVHEFFR